jgi:biotin operon repressor
MSGEQMELLSADTTWLHVFRDMIFRGEAAKMGPHGFTAYCVIKAHSSLNSGESFPSLETIAKESGMSVAQVKRELDKLESMGYLMRSKKGRVNEYKLREKVDILNDSGAVQAVATWDYVPIGVKAAVADLKNVIVTGDLAGARIVNIERMVVNINTGPGTQNNFNAPLGEIPEGPLGDSLRRLLENREKDREGDS